MEDIRNSEFKYLVDSIQSNYFMSHSLIASKLGISQAAFYRYYSGLVKPKNGLIDELNEIFEINDEDIENARKKAQEDKKFFDMAYKLSKLSEKRREEVYEVIEAYYKKENMDMTKTMTM